MSMGHKIPPYTTPTPGVISWAKVIPARISALCKARSPSSVIGPEEPAMTKSASSNGWPCRANSIRAPAISEGYWSGDNGVMRGIITGLSLILSFPPQTIPAISIASSAPCLPAELAINGLSQKTILESCMSRWAVSGGTSKGSTIIKPFMLIYFDV